MSHSLGKMTDFIKKGDDPNTAYEKASGQYGRVADAVKIIQIGWIPLIWLYTSNPASLVIFSASSREEIPYSAIGEGLQAFCIPGSVADTRKVGLGHGNLGKMLLEEDTECYVSPACILKTDWLNTFNLVIYI